MIGRQRAAPGKCIGSNCLSRAEGDAGRGFSASIIHRITELDDTTRAIGSNMDGGCIGHHNVCSARQPLNGCGTDGHIYRGDLKGGLGLGCALACWGDER